MHLLRVLEGAGRGGERTLTPTEVDMLGGRARDCDCGGAAREFQWAGVRGTTADAPLYVVRRVVTAASRRIEEVGRRSWSFFARFLRSIPTARSGHP